MSYNDAIKPTSYTGEYPNGVRPRMVPVNDPPVEMPSCKPARAEAKVSLYDIMAKNSAIIEDLMKCLMAIEGKITNDKVNIDAVSHEYKEGELALLDIAYNQNVGLSFMRDIAEHIFSSL